MTFQKDKEFVSVYMSNDLASNYKRILNDTTPKTQLNYHKRFVGWGIQSTQDIDGFLDTLDQKWKDGRYRYATVRQYKATIAYALSNIHQFLVDHQEMELKFKEYYALAKNSDKEELESLYQKTMAIGGGENVPNLDKKALRAANTSATKDKRFAAPLVDYLLSLEGEGSSKHIKNLQRFIRVNIKIGLRPTEYQHATLLRHDIAQNPVLLASLGFSPEKDNALGLKAISTDSNKPLLLVKNAKNTHQRACGEYRMLHLDVLSHEDIDELKIMMTAMRKVVADPDLDFDDDFIKPMGKTLHHILTTDKYCIKTIRSLNRERVRRWRTYNKGKHDATPEPIYKRPTLYSTRHQAVADTKAAGLDPVLIAACFGHSSIYTAESHYGHKAYGSGGLSLSPAQVSINEVVARLTEAASQPRLSVWNKAAKTTLDLEQQDKPTPKKIAAPRFR